MQSGIALFTKFRKYLEIFGRIHKILFNQYLGAGLLPLGRGPSSIIVLISDSARLWDCHRTRGVLGGSIRCLSIVLLTSKES